MHLLIFCNKRLQFWNLRLQNKENGKKEEDGNWPVGRRSWRLLSVSVKGGTSQG